MYTTTNHYMDWISLSSGEVLCIHKVEHISFRRTYKGEVVAEVSYDSGDTKPLAGAAEELALKFGYTAEQIDAFPIDDDE